MIFFFSCFFEWISLCTVWSW